MRSLVPALALAFLACSCTLNTDYFAEYRGVNLLGNYDFDAVESDGITPKWKLATSSDFVRWEKIGPTSSDPTRDTAASVPTVGPDGVSPVYRVEIKNLIPNGDFEDSTVTPDGGPLPAYWAMKNANGSAADPASVAQFGNSFTTPERTGSINGRILGWKAGFPGDQIALDLYSGVTSSSPTAWSPGRFFVLRMDLVDLSAKLKIGLFPFSTGPYGPLTSPALANNDWTVDTLGGVSAVHSTVNTFSTDPDPLDPTHVGWEPRFLAVGDDGTFKGPFAAAIDNVRVVPNDRVLGVQADFGSLESGAKPLLPGSKKGMYRFSLWVRNDPTTGTGNRFEAGELTVRLEAQVKSGDPSFQSPTGLRPAGGWPIWTLLQFDMGFDFVNTNTDLQGNPALSIFLVPTYGSTGNSDAGSLLVSQPSLTFNP